MGDLYREIERRWRQLFERLAAGEDVAPGPRLRTEGLMEAAVISGEYREDELLQRMEAVFREINGRPISDDAGDAWRALYPFPQIPVIGRRAPVYPSTRE